VIRRQVVMPVSPERLWEALTDPDQVSGWFGGRLEWELREGGPARFRGDDGTERVGRVEAVRPGRHLRFRWWPAGEALFDVDGPDVGDPQGGSADARDVSEVSYLLEAVEDGTRLTIQERQVARASLGSLADRRTPAAGRPPEPWTAWDERLAGAWARVGRPFGARAGSAAG
jgi:uncharacterized protein YndB with AHSA1/START domain